MLGFITSIFFALLAFYSCILAIKTYTARDIDKAIQQARRKFQDKRIACEKSPEQLLPLKLRPHKFLPLSEEMIKEIAIMEGHNYRGETSLHNDHALAFWVHPRITEPPHTADGYDV